MKIRKEIFGKVNNKEVYLFTITNPNGITVKITNYGGIITSIIAPDKNGNTDDIVLGYDNFQDYLDNPAYMGCIVGRYANRVAKASFTLDGIKYNLAKNIGEDSLHGGWKGFNKVVWNVEKFEAKTAAGIKLNYVSKDGEEAYPGNLEVTVLFTLNINNELKIEYQATTDKATPVNLTHHSYFNLNGFMNQNALNHSLKINADKFVAVDEKYIPTGVLSDLRNSPLDFNISTNVGSRINQVPGGYDHTYVLKNKNKFDLIAELSEPNSGRVIEVFTTEPGVQFYAGNSLDGSIKGKNGISYKKHYGLCLETQHFADSPNQPSFPNTILRPGEKYTQTTVYKFGIK